MQSMLERVVVPSRLALIYRAGSTLGYNPGLNVWEPLAEDTAEALRWLRAGRDRTALAPHLARRFNQSLEVVADRLRGLLGWCVLHRMLYLDAEPKLGPIDNGTHPLETVYWICTQACNLRCTYCYQDAAVARPRELSTDEARNLIEQVVEAGAKTFIFTGGEPFVRRDLLQLARYSRSAGLTTNIITNGHYINRENLAEVASLFHTVTISVDGTSESHDRNRGRGSWARAVQAIELLHEAGVTLNINSVLSRFGLVDVTELLQFVRKWHADAHRIIPQFPMGRGCATREAELTDEEVLGLGDLLYSAGKAIDRQTGMAGAGAAEGGYSSRLMRRNHCGAGLSEESVDPEGWVYPCKLLQYPQFRTANVRERRLADIFEHHPVLRTTRSRTTETLEPCKTCIIKNHCGGGCRGIHVSFTRDYARANPLFCAYLRHIFEVQAWSSSGDVPQPRRTNFRRAGARPSGSNNAHS